MKLIYKNGFFVHVRFSFWVCVIGLVGVQAVAGTIANSVNDFSSSQGYKNWSYGWGRPFSETNPTLSNYVDLVYYTNSTWRPHSSTNSPSVTPTGAHPGYESGVRGDWAIRRYVSPVSGLVRISGSSQHTQLGGGDGTTARLFINGFHRYAKMTASNGVSAGPIYTYAVTLKLNAYDILYMAIDDRANPDSDFTDFKLQIDSLPTRRLIADSMTDFAGTQRHADASGLGHWQYGERSGEVFSTNGWFYVGWWSNSNYRILSGWGQHPYTTNSVLVTRRWTSGVGGPIIIDGGIRKNDEQFPGDGVIVSILLNGTSTLYSATLNGVTNLNGTNDAIDIDSRLFTLTNNVVKGSTLDFTIDPRGNNNNDGIEFYVTITKDVFGALLMIQ